MLKRIVNGALQPFDLRVVRWRTAHFSGQYLFADLYRLLGTQRPVCLDVGANKGQTIDALLQAFKSPVIHAFEPSTATFERLRARSWPRDVHLHRVAMAAHGGEREFLNFSEPLLSSFLRPDPSAANPFRGAPISGSEIVPTQTVDAFLEQSQIGTLDLLKIDTQGFDLEVLKGARTSLQGRRIRSVMVELNFMPLYEGQPKPTQVMDHLESLGLNLVDFYEKEMKGNRMAWCTALFSLS